MKSMLPKRRFWKDEQKMKYGFRLTFSMVSGPHGVLTSLKSASKSGFHLLFILPKSSFGEHKIRIFEALFECVSTRFGLRTIEKSVENPDFIFCSSFQHLRLGSIQLFVAQIEYSRP